MSSVKFTADSTCDLNAALIKELDIEIMNFFVSLGDKTYRDGINVFPETIYDFVAEHKILPKTAAPSPEDYRQLFSKYTETYGAVIHFNISSHMSAANQNARIAMQDFKNVYVIDSQSLSTGTSLLMLKASDMHKQGKGGQEIADKINALAPKVQASFVVDTLEYLHKGGRCSGLARLGATILKLHPMLLVKGGEITVHKKLRGKIGEVYCDYAQILKNEFPSPDLKNAFITHSGCSKETIDAFRKKVNGLYKFENIYETLAGSTITSHCGKGTLGLLFINDENLTD